MGERNPKIFEWLRIERTKMKQRVMTSLALIVSIVFIIIGIIEKQNVGIFMKAIRICLECIGLG